MAVHTPISEFDISAINSGIETGSDEDDRTVPECPDASEAVEVAGKAKKPETTYTCEQCNFRTTYKYNLVRHMKCHDADQERLSCNQCPKTYIRKADLRDNKIIHHPAAREAN